MKHKTYPFIIWSGGKRKVLITLYGRSYFRECDKNGKIKRLVKPKCKIIPFKKN